MAKPYKYVDLLGYSIKTGAVGRYFSNHWLTITADGTVHVSPNYAWDGCSPKFKVLDLLFGTPDGAINPKTNYQFCYHPSLVHDALYQFKNDVPLTRKEADLIFKEMLKQQRFFWWRLYYLVVRLFGWIYGSWKETTSYPFIIWEELAEDDFIAKASGYTLRVEQMDFGHWWYSVTLKHTYSEIPPDPDSLPLLVIQHEDIYTPYQDGKAPASKEEAQVEAIKVMCEHFSKSIK